MVVPIAALMVIATVHEGFVRPHLTGDISSIPADGQLSVPAGSSANTVLLPNGVLRMEPGSRLDMSNALEPVLRQGSVTIVTHTLQTIVANGQRLEGWNGAYQVIVSGSGTTAVALTTPVLVSRSQARMIVPVAMQWKTNGVFPALSASIDDWLQARSLKSLPDAYLTEQLQTADDLSSSIKGIPSSLADAHTSPAIGILQLPAARERAEAADRLKHLDAVVQDLSGGGSTALTAMLSASDAKNLLTSDEGKNALPLLLSLAAAHGKADLLLPYVPVQTDLLLLGLYHPSIRDHLWVQQIPQSLDDDSRLALFAFFPPADNQTRAVSSIASARWLADFQSFLFQRKDAADILNDVLPQMADLVQTFSNEQYPERANRYTVAAQTLAQPYTSKLSPYGQAALTMLSSAQSNTGDIASAFSSASSESSASSVSSVPLAALETQTHVDLATNGFMFTPQTTLHGNKDRSVDVSNAVFGAGNGDQIVSFTYDPVGDVVSNIETDGSTLPYSLTLAQYVEWMRGGK